jgi:serine/threonine protein kinase
LKRLLTSLKMVDTTSNQVNSHLLSVTTALLTPYGQLFARKLIRPFGEVTLKDILDEAQAIEKLQKDIKCQNLVIVLRHGWLSSSPFYYIDMELCEANLEHYLHGKTSGYDTCNNPRFLGAIFETRGICHTWDIMHQISLGIDFIHSCKQVHRDLKPRNGISVCLYSADC